MVQNKFYNIGTLGLKIALFSDIHYDSKYDSAIFSSILENVLKNRPDYICIVGDILDDSSLIKQTSYLIKLKEFIKNLGQVAPTIITLGNHDISIKNKKGRELAYFKEVQEWFLSLNTLENVTYLYNKSYIRDNICFTAFNPSYSYYGDKDENSKIFIDEIDKEISLKPQYYNILLSHSPINIFKNEIIQNSKEIKKANLILSGHMHNGMVLKIFDHFGTRGLISPYKKLFPKYARGISFKKIDYKKIYLVVSGGVVKLSENHSKCFNFLNCLYPISIDYITI